MRERWYANLKGDIFRIFSSLIFGIKYLDDEGPDSQNPTVGKPNNPDSLNPQ